MARKGFTFTLDTDDMKKYNKFMKKMPRAAGHASAEVLNRAAFKVRGLVLDRLEKNMEVRNARFVQSRIRVQRTKTSLPMNRQEAIVGSIKSARFSGWAEQEFG